MTPLQRLRDADMTVRYDSDDDKLLVGPKAKLPAWKAFIAEHRAAIIADLDQEKKEAAIRKLPFVEFQDGPVQMRSILLLKIWNDYLAVTPEEAATLGWSDIDKETENAGRSGRLSQPETR